MAAAAVRRSAGILVYRRDPDSVRVLLAHMGGPYFARRDEGAWTVPKGEPDPGEDLETTARREFAEELGLPVPAGALVPLGEVTQKGGKVVTAWAVEGDLDPADVVPGTFEMEWPKGSGRIGTFPEVDRAAWWTPAECAERINPAQLELIDRLIAHLAHLGLGRPARGAPRRSPRGRPPRPRL
jgi:predicted NUDIX family NTP pyrophosphohydrolase